MRANEGAIQHDLFSEKSLEWLMLIDILVIWSCFAHRAFFPPNMLSYLMFPTTVYLVIFLWEWYKRHLISSHLPSKWPISQIEHSLLMIKSSSFLRLCLPLFTAIPPSPPLFLIRRLWARWLSLWLSDRRLVFLGSPFENVIRKVRYTVPLYALLSKYHNLAEKCWHKNLLYLNAFDESVVWSSE